MEARKLHQCKGDESDMEQEDAGRKETSGRANEDFR